MLMDYSSFEITYHVEIAIVIDATGGMNPHFVLAFMGQIMMAFAENPEGMQRLYKTVK